MTTTEYCETYGYSRSSVASWLSKGLIPGAAKVNGVWNIPKDARPRYKPRKKNNRSVTDNMFDFVKALHKRLYVDARILRCSDSDYKDLLSMLLQAEIIRESTHPADGMWHTGFALTIKGREYATLSKREFVNTVTKSVLPKLTEVAAGFVVGLATSGALH